MKTVQKKEIDITGQNIFIPPEKNYKQIKIELVQKTIMELKKLKEKEDQNDN